ncbi:hypothetical protein [Neolewinella persica]|uniref:hypothetical protein n=1 Tax=Neolewinella persica TaxID=70998 RepID=UPI000362EBBB|nr:hypothetical protein [Neolewinella persica]
MRLKLSLLLLLTISFGSNQLIAQDLEQEGEYGVDWGGYLFGIKGGPSLGNQDWSGLETELLLAYHGALYYETIPAQGRFSFFGQLGYHVRGSKISRRRGFTFNGGQVTLPADDFRFQNVSAAIGGKSVFAYTRAADIYYVLGLRVDYTLSNNLSEYNDLSNSVSAAFRLNYPIEVEEPTRSVRPIMAGAIFGAGALIPISDKTSGFIEITANPDFTFQYNQGPIENVIDPFGGAPRTIGARQIRNFTIEISFGLRFMRKWKYVN